METTLNEIGPTFPNYNNWQRLLNMLGKSQADDAPLSFVTIAESIGLENAVWCLKVLKNEDATIRLFAVWCARQVQSFTQNIHALRAIDVAERFANEQASRDELIAAFSDGYRAAHEDKDSSTAFALFAAYQCANPHACAAAAGALTYAAKVDDPTDSTTMSEKQMEKFREMFA